MVQRRSSNSLNLVSLFPNNILLLSFYIIKQDIRIYVPYSRPNSWTEWAEFFCGHTWVVGCLRLKKIEVFFSTFFSTGNTVPFS